MKTNLLLSAVLILAGGCVVGPDYHRPETAVPAKWSEPLAGGETNAAAQPGDWWKNFHDPELDSLIDRATRSNLDLRAARARVREARARLGKAAADLGPAVDAAGSYSRERASQRQPVLGSIPLPANVPFENNVYQAGFDASWEIDVFGGKRRAVESASAGFAASEDGSGEVMLTLLGDVARNYIDARARQRRIEIARANIAAQEESLAITRDRLAHGLVGELDTEQAATLLETTRAEVPALEIALETSIHRLDILLGLPPGALAAEFNTRAPVPAAPPSVPVGLPSDLLLRRPDVRRAERELAAANADIGVATADLFPKFSLTGVAGFESVGVSDWFSAGSRFWSAGPTVTWKIFDAGRVRANIKVQNARQEQALAAYERATLGAFEEVENALVAFAKEQTRRRSLAEAAGTSRQSLAVAKKLYVNGLTDFVNVLEAERALYQAEDALARSDSAVSTDVVALYKSLGGGWAGKAKG